MLPSLKSMYSSKLQSILEEIKKNPQIIREVIDQRMIDEMDKSLKKLAGVLKTPELASLDSFHLGLQKAHNELSNILAFGDLRSWAHSFIPKGFTAIGRVASFTTGLTKLLKQLPKIIDIVKGSMDSERRAAWNPNEPLDRLLDSDTSTKLLKIIVKAMEPPDELLSFTWGLPYVNDKEAAAEILGLSYNQLAAFSKSSQTLQTPNTFAQADEIGQDIKNVLGKEEHEDAGDERQSRAGSSTGAPERLIIPGGGQAAAALPKQAQQPTTRAVESDLSDIFDETLYSMLGERGLKNKNFEQFKPKFIKNMLMLMLKKNYIKREPRPKQQD